MGSFDVGADTRVHVHGPLTRSTKAVMLTVTGQRLACQSLALTRGRPRTDLKPGPGHRGLTWSRSPASDLCSPAVMRPVRGGDIRQRVAEKLGGFA